MIELLRSAIENVVRNALKYSTERSAIEISAVITKNQTIEINVQDYGEGVPENVLKNIFLPFYRVADDRDRVSGGTGLGLSIAKRAVKSHGGSIKAANIKNKGLMITIVLPLIFDETKE